MAHSINANLLFKWRREHREAEAACAGAAQAASPLLLPITLAPATLSDAAVSSPPVPTPCATRTAGSIDLDFAGARLRLRGAVDQESLVALLAALRSLA
jgi:transposase